MFKRLILAVLIITATTTIGFSQASKLKRAKSKMEKLDYIGAIKEYNHILALNDDPTAKINIAECYRKISDSENAEYWYGQVVRLPESEPVHKLFYAQALQRNGKCDLAKEWFVKFIDEVPDDLRGQYLVKACDYEEELMTKNAGLYEIKHMDFNSSLDDFGPSYYEDGLLFASERGKGGMVSRVHAWTGSPFLNLYYVDTQVESTDDGSCGEIDYGRPSKFSNDLNGKYHDSNPILSPDKSTLYFTRNNDQGHADDGTVLLKIYFAEKKGENDFGKLMELPFNSDEYNVAHPALSLDGEKLYFSSDMPGGFGGMDLYMSEKDGGNWGPPTNLGPQINTEGNEIFPFYSADKKLYFASNGHVGLGGLDIYYMEDKGDGEFGSIVNIGYPLNTVSDDFGLIFNETNTCGYFSSDRTGGAGNDDIYSFAKIAAPVEIYVFDEVTNEPIEGATVVDDCTGASYTTNEEGKIYADIKLNECCTYKASKELYVDNEKEGCSTAELTEKVFVEIPMAKEMQFDLEGVTFNGADGMPLPGVMLTLTNDCGEDEETATSDKDGRFYFKLRNDCCYSLAGSKVTFSGASVDNQCTKGLTESTTLQANLTMNPENQIATTTTQPTTGVVTGLPQTTTPETGVYNKDGVYVDAQNQNPYTGDHNGVTYKDGKIIGGQSHGFDVAPSTNHTDFDGVSYLLHIYYDFDQSYIRDEAVPDLERLLAMMNQNPSYIIEIGSHTDSRGSKRYNRGLSERRAKSVVRWLTKHGIDGSRLVARGYGETIHVNDCTDNVKCSETQHQFNRRTEFKVIGCSTCADGSVYSQPKTAPKVDKCNNCPF